LHKLVKKEEELSSRLGVLPSSIGLVDSKDAKQTAEAISQLKYRAMEAKNKYEHAIEQEELEKAQSVKSVKLPSLPKLPSRVEELQQQIALHNVSYTAMYLI
jgi:ERCC4-type nuclease